ncbi:hypothetical protein FH972_003484 [Carpinus fangiana]|uniref:Uncharacterized protein n=1 Tax=Carpinus fangiana TaxID=176857 RepID=A0A5N6QIB1_9ROSI|nr:hypothetical protein FH972_003484 [Carpinus fangiana]
MDLPTQVIHFKTVVKTLKQEIGDAEAEKVLSRAVYLFSNGGNDYFSFSTNNRNATPSQQAQFVGMVIGNLTSILKELYGLGVRKIAFQNVGPLGCTPTMKFVLDSPHASECVEPPLALATLHNKALAEALKNLETKLPGFKYSIFDYYHELLDRIKNPSKYGFENGETACCGGGKYRAFYCGGGGSGTQPFDVCKDPNEYVWFDGAHTSEKTNNQLAHLIWSGEPPVTGPYNLQQLFEHA